MSLTDPIPRGTRETTLVAGAGQTVFGPINDWQLYDAADLEIRITNPGDDYPALLAPDQFTAAPAAPATAFPAYFTLTLAAAAVTGASVDIRGVRIPTRTTDVTRGGRFQSQAMELELDRLTVIGQELRRDINRGFIGDDAVSAAVAAAQAAAATATIEAATASAAAASIISSATPTFANRTAMIAASIASGIQFALVADTAIGFVELYGKIATPGTVKSYHLQSADGAWWTPSGKVINLATWGVPMNNAANDGWQAVQDVLDKVSAAGGGIVFHPGGTIYNVSKKKWLVPGDISLFGVGDISQFKANGMTVPMFQSNGGVGAGAVRRYRQYIRDFSIDNTVGPAAAGFIGWDWRNVSLGEHRNIKGFNFDVFMQFYADAGLGCYYVNGFGSRGDTGNIAFDFGSGANENATFGCSGNACNIGLREADTSHNVHLKFEAAVCATANIQVAGAAYDCNLISPRIENIAPANGTGIKVASTAVNTVIDDPQYTNIATPLDNASSSTKVNGRRALAFTVDRGTINHGTTDDYSVTVPGFARDDDAVELTPSYLLPGNLMMQAVRGSGVVFSRTANVGATDIDPPSMTHLLTWWKPGGD